MKACTIAVAAALQVSLPALADDDSARTRQSTTIHKDDTTTMHRSERGERNANNPGSPNRALGRERAEERHEMNEHRDMRGKGGTNADEQHRMMRREHDRVDQDDRGNIVKRRIEEERHEKSER